jgi:hypothetical protein
MCDEAITENPTWTKRTTSQDVINFAQRRMSFLLAKFAMACTDHDDIRMVQAVKGMRGVSTRVDQFRRMVVREVLAADAAKSNKGRQTK